MAAPGPFKVAYIGGGSLFVPSILHGVARGMREASTPFAVEVVLFDIVPEKAERMACYGNLLASAVNAPLTARATPSRAEAIDGAGLVLLSVSLGEDVKRLREQLAFDDAPDPERWHGLAEMAEAVAVAPFHLDLAEEVRRRAPTALILGLVNPTDVMAGLLRARYGVRSAGICVEVYGLIGALAYYFRVPEATIELDHVGVNHDGWVLRLRVDGRDGYELWRDRWETIPSDPQYHRGNLVMLEVLRLTGHLRTSAYHRWPLTLSPPDLSEPAGAPFPAKRSLYVQAIEAALSTGRPIPEPDGEHPERSPLNYPTTGRAIGRLVRGMAAGSTERITLQVPNGTAIANFDPDAVVEVPVRVRAGDMTPIPMGEAPEWLCGTTRLIAHQRRRFIDYLLDPQLDALQRALFTLPTCGTVQQYRRFAERLHRAYTSRMEAMPG